MLTVVDNKKVQESVEGAEVVSNLGNAVIPDDTLPVEPSSTPELVVEPNPVIDNPSTASNPYEISTDDARFIEIVELYKGEGYSCAFIGNGFVLSNPDKDPLFRIICRDLFEGFKINILGSYLNLDEIDALIDDLATVSDLIYRANNILNQMKEEIE